MRPMCHVPRAAYCGTGIRHVQGESGSFGLDFPQVNESLGVSPPAETGPPTQPDAAATPLPSSRATAVIVTSYGASFETADGAMESESR